MTFRPRQSVVFCCLVALALSAGWIGARRLPGQETAPAKQPGEKEPAKEEDPNLRFYERPPHDELRLRDGKTKEGQEKETVVKIRPLGPPQIVNDELPKNITIKVEIRLIDRPGQTFEVQRGKIIEWIRFRELILREAERLVAAGNFDE